MRRDEEEMRILIFGASGTVGSAVFQELSGEYEVHGTFNKRIFAAANMHHWEISDTARLNALLAEIRPEIIISSLRGDFLQQSAAHKKMADYLKAANGRMIFISTANVFDGAVAGGHDERQVPYPISQYGDFKKSCEEMLLWGLGKNCLIARLPKILTVARPEGRFSNLYYNYNTPQNVARALKLCIKKNKRGVQHLVSRDYICDAQGVGEELTPEKYCELLGCDDVSKLRQSPDGKFYLTMLCTDEELKSFATMDSSSFVPSGK